MTTATDVRAARALNFPRQSAAVQELSTALRELVYSFAARISVAEAIGALEVVKHEVIEEQKNG